MPSPLSSRRPRAVFVDLELSDVDEVRRGNFPQLFHHEQINNGKEGESVHGDAGVRCLTLLILERIS
jgi:hypothetical protein